MMFFRKKFLRQPSIIISLAIITAGIFLFRGDNFFFMLIELKTIDLRFLFRDEKPPGSQIALVVVDEKSLDREGKWPWPRAKIARLVQQLSQAGAKVVTFDIGFNEPDDRRVIRVIDKIQKKAASYGVREAKYRRFLDKLKSAEDNDGRLADAIRTSQMKTVLGWFFYTDADVENIQHLTPQELEQYEKNIRSARYLFTRADDSDARADLSELTKIAPEPNITALAEATSYSGYFNYKPDQDGVIRRMHTVLEFNNNIYASLPLMTLSAYYNEPLHLEIDKDGGVLGACIGDRICVPTDEQGRMMINFRGEDHSFLYISATDVLHHVVPAERIKDKIIIVGATAMGTYDLVVTPYSNTFPGPEVHANVIDNILAGDFLQQLEAFKLVTICLMVILGTILGVLLTRVGMIGGSIGALSMFFGYIALCQFLFVRFGVVLNMVYPLMVILVIYISVTAYKYFVEESQKRFIRNTFSRYLAPTVVQQLIESGHEVALGGEQREITAFFSDVQGFTSIAEKLSPQSLVELLNEFLTEMTDIILKYEGTVDKFEGDAIIAFFGAPNVLKNHAWTATMACIEMQKKMSELRKTWRTQNRPELKMRIGLCSGIAVVGNMGSRNRMDYTMMGDTVNIAARLEGVNKIYGTYILIGESTEKDLNPEIIRREVDSIHVVGKKVPVAIYEPLGFSSELDGKIIQTIDQYHQGLTAYRRRNWVAAAACFRKALELSPEDGPSKTLLARCEAYRRSPPPEDWDGAYTMRSK